MISCWLSLPLWLQIASMILATIACAILLGLGLVAIACRAIVSEKSAPYPPGYEHPE